MGEKHGGLGHAKTSQTVSLLCEDYSFDAYWGSMELFR